MSAIKPLILRLISFCVPLADHAGQIIRDVMERGELNIVDKGIRDFQTEADRLAQQFIVSSLTNQFSNVTIIGEEDDSMKTNISDVIFDKYDESILLNECPLQLQNIEESRVTIWVDPLDGTSEYTEGLLDHVTVLIGIAVDEKAVAGVINQPYYGYKNTNNCGRTIWGIDGLGAFGFTPSELPTDRLIITTTRSRSNEIVQAAINSMNADEVIRVGGAGHKVLLLLEGKAHAYVFANQGCKRWDTCAPEAILRAAGGRLTDIDGDPYNYHKNTMINNTGGVFASAREAEHSKILNLLPNHVKENLKK